MRGADAAGGSSESWRADGGLGVLGEPDTVQRDGASEAKPDSGARWPRCTPASAEPTSLARLPGLPGDHRSIAVLGDSAYVSGYNSSDEGHILVVTLATGALRSISLGATLPSTLVALPDALYFASGRSEHPDPQTTAYTFDKVGRLDLATDKVSMVPNHTGYIAPRIHRFLKANGDILWIVGEGMRSPFTLMRWAPSTGKLDVILSRERLNYLQFDGADLYWLDRNPAEQDVWSSMPLDGGPIVNVFTWPSETPREPGLLAVEGAFLYYNFFGDFASGIQAMPKAGGPGKTVVPNADPVFYATDGIHHYWSDNGKLTLYRAPMGGGQTEIVWNVENRWIRAIAFDACNLYMLALNPDELLVRAK